MLATEIRKVACVGGRQEEGAEEARPLSTQLGLEGGPGYGHDVAQLRLKF